MIALLLCTQCAVAGRWIARFVPLALDLGVAVDATPELYPLLRAEVGSVAIGYATQSKMGLAVGTKLTEPFLLPAVRFTYPPLYIYGTYGVVPGEALSQPVVSLFLGMGLLCTDRPYPLPYGRAGVQAEWRLGLFTPTVEVSYLVGAAVTFTAGLRIGGWRALGHSESQTIGDGGRARSATKGD